MKDARAQKSRLEFQVVKSPSSRDFLVRSEKPPIRPWIQVAFAVGLALLSCAFVITGSAGDASTETEHLEKLASLGAELVLADIAGQHAVLEAQCAVLAEDPRIKSTLATDGMDAASIADILTDLNESAAIQLSAILAQDGRVIASAGADSLEGLDLQSSGVFRTARRGAPASASWIFGTKLLSVAGIPIFAGDRQIAFLLLGRGVGDSAVPSAARLSQTSAMLRVANQWSSPPPSAEYQAAFEAAADLSSGPVRGIPNFAGHVSEIGGTSRSAKLIFLAKKSESSTKRQAMMWAPSATLIGFAVMLLLSKLNSRN